MDDLEKLIKMLRSNGVRHFKGVDIELLLDPHIEMPEPNTRIEDGTNSRLNSAYSDPKLWRGRAAPSID